MSTSAHECKSYLANNVARDIANSLFQKWALKGFFRRVSAASRGRGQPRRGYRRPKPTAHSDVGRLRSRRAACFLWYLLSLRKKVLPPSGRQPHHPRRSRRVNPHPGQGDCAHGRTKGLSSGQTIGAVRTAVRSACCLPELRVANRLRRLYPLDDGELFKFNLKSSVCQRQTGLPKGNPPCVFPSFPFGNLLAPKLARKPMGRQVPLPHRSRRARPLQGAASKHRFSKANKPHGVPAPIP